MNKRPILPALSTLCAIIFLAVALPVFATDNGMNNNSGPVTLETMVVTASRWEMPRAEVAANITVITRKELEELPASNLSEVLRYIPGVTVEANGGLGSETAVRIQGSEFRHVTVFQDGVPLNMLATPRTDLSYIPVDTIERIEVYKGAASSAWGSALGG